MALAHLDEIGVLFHYIFGEVESPVEPPVEVSKRNFPAEVGGVPLGPPPLDKIPIRSLFSNIFYVLEGVKDKLDKLENKLKNVERTCLQSFNLEAGDGLSVPWKEIPFLNGDIPTTDPHNLPAIHNSSNVESLTEEELTSYLAGYGIFVPPEVEDRGSALSKWLEGKY